MNESTTGGSGPAHRPATATFTALRIRNFRLLFIGQGISAVGNWATLITQSLLVFEITGNGAMLGLVSACQFVPILVLSSWTGLVADRNDKLRLTIRLQALAMVQSATLFLVAVTNDPSVVAICGLAVVSGVINSFDTPCRRALGAETVPEPDIASAVNLTTAVVTTSSIIGPLVAGLLILGFGHATVFAVDAASYLAVLTALRRMDRSQLRTPPVLPRRRGQIRYAVLDVWRTPDLRLGMGVAALSGAAYNFPVVLPLLVKDVYGHSDGAFTLMYAWLSVGSVLGALSVGRRASVVGRDLVYGMLRFACAMAVLAVLPWFGASLLWAAVIGFTGMSAFNAGVTLAHYSSGERMRGRVMAFHSMCFLGSLAVGAPLIGLLSDHAGARVGVLASAGCPLVAAAWASFALARRSVPPTIGCPARG